MTQKKNLIIVGNGMVGHYCAEQLVMHGLHEQYDVHIFGEERHQAYDRVHLTEYMTGQDALALAQLASLPLTTTTTQQQQQKLPRRIRKLQCARLGDN